LDDPAVLSAARADPTGFIRGLDRVIIDEIQRAPELMLSIKESVDRDPRPGRFLLTGSTNILALPTLADSLAGRMAMIRLYPLAQAEIRSAPGSMIDRLFAGDPPLWPRDPVFGPALLETMLAGGYPEAIARADPERRREWLEDYLRLVLDRDVRDIANLEQLHLMPRLMAMLAEHAGQLTVAAHLASPLQISALTVQRYMAILQRLYLVDSLPAWHSNRLSRLLKTPKIHFIDTGLLASLRGDPVEAFEFDKVRLGPIAESFAYTEILKQLTWSRTRTRISHFRTKEGDEVDLVLEDNRGRIVGIEVKAGATLRMKDFSGLKKLEQAAGDLFVRGLILHDHDRITPVSEKIQGAPMSLLWQM
jgi:predicted AAA+ superfamily ATPase